MADLHPPIPASMAHRPVRGGLALPWVNAELADGGVDFRSPHTAKYEAAWRKGLCQSCGRPYGPRAVLVCGPRQLLTLHFDEPPVCPPCAVYASQACPFVSGRAVVYSGRQHLTEGHRGEKCFDPACGCSGWQETDPDHSGDMGGQPNLTWYACWIRPRSYVLTGHTARTRCSDLGCEHERTLVNGANLTALPAKVQLVSEPGRETVWTTMTAAEALAHAAAAINAAGVKPAERSPMWDGKPFVMPGSAPEQAPKPTGPKVPRKRRLPRAPEAMSQAGRKQALADQTARRNRLRDAASRVGEQLARLEAEGETS